MRTAYDKLGNRTRLIYPNSKTVTYTYDALNRLVSVTDWHSSLTTTARAVGCW